MGLRTQASALATLCSTEVWRGAARIVGAAVSLRAEPVSSAGRVLVVAPHPDDETIGCGGTIAAHKERGDDVHVVVVTDGSASRRSGRPAAEVRATRSAELDAACRFLGVDEVTELGLSDGCWSSEHTSQARHALTSIIDTSPPDVLYAPSCLDLHPDHRGVAEALAASLGAHQPIVRIYQTYVPLTPLVATRAFDVSPYAATLELAVAAHRSQREGIERFLRLRRYDAAMFGAAIYAEVFWELDAADYVALHQTSAPARYRAPTRSALRDPLCYLVGLDARRALIQRLHDRRDPR